jgi:hypothetical protein
MSFSLREKYPPGSAADRGKAPAVPSYIARSSLTSYSNDIPSVKKKFFFGLKSPGRGTMQN